MSSRYAAPAACVASPTQRASCAGWPGGTLASPLSQSLADVEHDLIHDTAVARRQPSSRAAWPETSASELPVLPARSASRQRVANALPPPPTAPIPTLCTAAPLTWAACSPAHRRSRPGRAACGPRRPSPGHTRPGRNLPGRSPCPCPDNRPWEVPGPHGPSPGSRPEEDPGRPYPGAGTDPWAAHGPASRGPGTCGDTVRANPVSPGIVQHGRWPAWRARGAMAAIAEAKRKGPGPYRRVSSHALACPHSPHPGPDPGPFLRGGRTQGSEGAAGADRWPPHAPAPAPAARARARASDRRRAPGARPVPLSAHATEARTGPGTVLPKLDSANPFRSNRHLRSPLGAPQTPAEAPWLPPLDGAPPLHIDDTPAAPDQAPVRPLKRLLHVILVLVLQESVAPGLACHDVRHQHHAPDGAELLELLPQLLLGDRVRQRRHKKGLEGVALYLQWAQQRRNEQIVRPWAAGRETRPARTPGAW